MGTARVGRFEGYVLIRSQYGSTCNHCGESHQFMSATLRNKCGHPVLWPILPGRTPEELYGTLGVEIIDPAGINFQNRWPIYMDALSGEYLTERPVQFWEEVW